MDSNDTPIITPSSGDWSPWAEYRYRSDDSTYVYYDLWNTGAANGGDFSYSESDNTNNDGGYQIRVSKTTGDWSDYPHTGTHPPTGVSTTNGNVALGTLFTFVKPLGTGQTPWMSDPNTPSTLKWNFSDKHDGTAEGFNVHDDQSPPCYVEKASDGTWSLTLTGDLANRQDQSAGNNWDYIETTGGTVYLNFKNWDTDGYWSGPYTRAQWSSSIGSETIRIYEHSSYSEQYNNGIFLIQES